MNFRLPIHNLLLQKLAVTCNDDIPSIECYMEPSPELPWEITCFHILPRLPAKSLIRFRCVCKSWLSLTRDPSFVSAHHNFHYNKLTYLLLSTWDKATRQQYFLSVQINQEGSPEPATHPLNPLTLPHDHRLYSAQSANGLVCLHLCNTISIRGFNLTNLEHPIRIFNPCTRESIILPHAFPTNHTAQDTYHFGFSRLTNEYKVLQVQRFEPRDSITSGTMTFMFKIFKLGTSLWRRIEVDPNDIRFDPFKCPFFRRSVCVNGAIHWMHVTQNVIVVFDIVDEKFRVIPLPKDYNCVTDRFNYAYGNMVEVDGCLALIGDRELMEQNMMGLWILKDYQNQVWVKEIITFPVPMSELGYPVPLCTIHSGDLLFRSSKLRRQDPAPVRLHLYSRKSKSFTGSEIVFPAGWTSPDDTGLMLLVTYGDSIVTLN